MGQTIAATEVDEELTLAIPTPDVGFATLFRWLGVVRVRRFGRRLTTLFTPVGNRSAVGNGVSISERANSGCGPLAEFAACVGFVVISSLYDRVDLAVLCHL
ncbi:hypothetical protein [Saliphagus sp. LR7]|uniref:hypothetical protein n=1 Tax=Saliphagus sp. LR7 TaxID=2282654 RepID=UPI0013005957|nr:hypothetical protein [Saliphagus sp. LR7]